MQMAIEWLVPVALAVTMFGMGLGLTIGDFTKLVTAPKAVIVGSLAQVAGLPVVGFLVATVLGLDGPMALGLVLIAACPGGPTSNLLTAFARGDLALSIVLTALSGVLTIVTLPLIVNAAAARYMPDAPGVLLPVWQTMGQILLVTLLPTAAGMHVRHHHAAIAGRLEPAFRRFALAVLTVLIVGTVLRERSQLLGHIRQVGAAVIALNLLAMTMAWAVARAARLGAARTLTITIEVGLQNAVMAMGVALALLHRADVAIPAVVYAGFMYVTAGVVVLRARRDSPPIPPPATSPAPLDHPAW